MTKPKDLFANLIWPAAAGNVTWSFIYLAIEKELTTEVASRLAVLLLVGVYMGYEWWRLNERKKVWGAYWVLDALFVLAVVVFAIGTYFGRPWLDWSLCSVFAVGILGHASGAWMERLDKQFNDRWKETRSKRAAIAGVNALGVAALPLLKSLGVVEARLPIAILIVLLALWLVRSQFFRTVDGV